MLPTSTCHAHHLIFDLSYLIRSNSLTTKEKQKYTKLVKKKLSAPLGTLHFTGSNESPTNTK